MVKTVPKGIPLRIKSYRFKENDLPFSIKGLPYLSAITNNEQDLQKHAQTFRTRPTAIIVCPGMQRLFIKVDGLPYAQMKALAGPPQGSLLAFAVKQGQPIEWDIMLTTPTDPGNYSIFRSTSHYLSNAYYRSTVVPFGAWIIRRNGKWVFQKGNKWIRLPAYIIQDLARPVRLQKYNYYDVSLDQAGKIRAARWASHDFGKYVLQWTKNGKTFYPEMGYAAGELLYEQIILVKDLVHILTLPGPDDFNFLVSQNKNFMFYKKLREFILTKGKVTADEVPLEMYSYYRLYNDMELTKDDFQRIDTRILKAYDE